MNSNHFLQQGHLTKPTPILVNIAKDIPGEGPELLRNIFHTVRNLLKASASKVFPPDVFIKKLHQEHLKRSADQILHSDYHYGCDEFAVVIATLARLKGIPTKYIQCSEVLGYVVDKHTNGHVFLECLLGKNRYLLDSTRGSLIKLEVENDKQKLYVSNDPDHKYLYVEAYSGLDSWEAGVKSHQEMIKRLEKICQEFKNAEN